MKMFTRALFFCFVAIMPLAMHAGTALDVDSTTWLVKTNNGLIRGTTDNGVRVWRGIRYAKAPVGELRFRDPQPVEAWAGAIDATQFGPMAPQVPTGFVGEGAKNEDCLFLNIWSPVAAGQNPGAEGKKLPVMFWIHGGAFALGSGSSDMYNGAALAQKGDVVVVTINYRLGPLGFLYFKDIAGTQKGFDNNLGIKDQIAALKWVRDNIASFGGDANSITIFGESAGGSSVLTLMASPAAKGLFARAIVQSASPKLTWDAKMATIITKKYLELLHVSPNELDKLKQLPVDTLIAATNQLDDYLKLQLTMNKTFSPTIDGEILPKDMFVCAKAGQTSNVPLLIGTNKNESSLFAMKRIGLVPTKAKKMEAYFTQYTPEQIKQVTGTYKKYPRKAGVLDLATDAVFRIPALQFAQGQAQQAPVYMYRFDWSSFPLRLIGLKSFHGLEIPFVFGNIHSGLAKKVSVMSSKKKVEGLAANMQQAWINFAHTGNPNKPGDQNWQPFNTQTYPLVIFNSKITYASDPDQKQRKAWEAIGY